MQIKLTRFRLALLALVSAEALLLLQFAWNGTRETWRTPTFSCGETVKQATEILEYVGDRRSLLAGNFNAEPTSLGMRLFRSSTQFAGEFAGPPTYLSDRPSRCTDYTLAPSDWQLIEHQVLGTTASNHRLILSIFAPPPAEE